MVIRASVLAQLAIVLFKTPGDAIREFEALWNFIECMASGVRGTIQSGEHVVRMQDGLAGLDETVATVRAEIIDFSRKFGLDLAGADITKVGRLGSAT